MSHNQGLRNFFFLLVSLTAIAAFGDAPKHYRAGVRHIESGGIGYKNGYTTIEAFLSPDPNEWIATPFLDARAHVFNNGKWAANAGVGLIDATRTTIVRTRPLAKEQCLISFNPRQRRIQSALR